MIDNREGRWQRWPTAALQLDRARVEELDEARRPIGTREEDVLVVTRGRGAGVDYPLAPHGAAWRSFGETVMDVATSAAPHVAGFAHLKLLAFVKRYGPLLPGDTVTGPFASGMLAVATNFRTLGRAWSTDPELSVITDDVARQVERGIGLWFKGWSPPTDQLLGFLVNSAVVHIEKRISMRRCGACGNWLTLSRSDRRYCDQGCAAVERRPAGRRRGRWNTNPQNPTEET